MTITKLHRRDAGRPLREAMRTAGLSGPALAAATRQIDASGRGISPATVGKLAGQGGSAGEVCRLRTAWLIAEVLDVPMHRIFAMPTVSTDTVER